MKKWMLVLVLAALAAAAVALADYAIVQLERETETPAGYLGKVAAIVPASHGVALVRTTWENTAEVVTVQNLGSTNTTTVTNWSRAAAGEVTNTLAVGDFVLPEDTLRETNGIPLTEIVLEL